MRRAPRAHTPLHAHLPPLPRGPRRSAAAEAGCGVAQLDPTQAKDTVAQQQARAARDAAAKAGGAGGLRGAASDSEDDSEDSDEEEEADGAPAAAAPQRPPQLAPQWRLADASGAPGGKEELAQRLQVRFACAGRSKPCAVRSLRLLFAFVPCSPHSARSRRRARAAALTSRRLAPQRRSSGARRL